jgi:acyl phosphate:glycerol-3-phosphate acyltransferase
MTMTPLLVALFAGSYLLGGVPFGLIVARLKGVDIRKVGSGNIGATNVGRTLGRQWGVLVFLLDTAKGAATVLAARALMTNPTSPLVSLGPVQRDLVLLGTGLCCVIGNIASIYLGFRGGKGVATSLGVVMGIFPYLTWPGLTAGVIWALVVRITRYVSLGSLVAAITLPIAFVMMSWAWQWPLDEHYPLLGLCLALALAVVLRHRANIGRLLAGTENKIGGPRT